MHRICLSVIWPSQRSRFNKQKTPPQLLHSAGSHSLKTFSQFLKLECNHILKNENFCVSDIYGYIIYVIHGIINL